jgi:predicted TPR repeat methyltransferase
MTDEDDYHLTPSGRFAHRKRYLDQLAKVHALEIVHYSAIPLRKQDQAPVFGHLYLLRA